MCYYYMLMVINVLFIFGVLIISWLGGDLVLEFYFRVYFLSLLLVLIVIDCVF